MQKIKRKYTTILRVTLPAWDMLFDLRVEPTLSPLPLQVNVHAWDLMVLDAPKHFGPPCNIERQNPTHFHKNKYDDTK